MDWNYLLIAFGLFVIATCPPVTIWIIVKILRRELALRSARNSWNATRKEVSCDGRNCIETEFTVEKDWRAGLYALDWRSKDGKWYCPMCLYADYDELEADTLR